MEKLLAAFSNWKTAVPALVAALVNLVGVVGVTIPAEVVSSVNTLALFLIGLFAADAKEEPPAE